MEKTTGGPGALTEAHVASAEEKSKKSLFGSFFSTYKIPLFSLVLFGSFSLHALYPQTFNFGLNFFRKQSDNFSFGLIIGIVSKETNIPNKKS